MIRTSKQTLTLLLCKMNGVFLCPETHAQCLVIIRTVDNRSATTVAGSVKSNARAGPSHELVLPSTTSLQDIKIYPPPLALRASALHGVSGRDKDSDLAVSKLHYATKGLKSTRIFKTILDKNTPGAPLMTSAARTSFGCCGVISVEEGFSLETTGAPLA